MGHTILLLLGMLLIKDAKKRKKKFNVKKTGMYKGMKEFLTIKYWKNWIVSGPVINTVKYSIALAISLVFPLVNKVDQTFLHLAFLVIFTVIFFDMNLPPTASVQFTIFAILSLFINAWVCTAAIYSSTNYGWAMALWLALVVFVGSWIRGRMQAKFGTSVIFGTILGVLQLLYGYRYGMQFWIDPDSNIAAFYSTAAMGFVISTLVNILIFPRRVLKELRKEGAASLKNIHEALVMTSLLFTEEIQNADVEKKEQIKNQIIAKQGEIQGHIANSLRILGDFEPELHLGCYSPKQVQKIVHMWIILSSLAKRLLSSSLAIFAASNKSFRRQYIATLSDDFVPQLKVIFNDCEVKIASLRKYLKPRHFSPFFLRAVSFKHDTTVDLKQSLIKFDEANKKALAKLLITHDKDDDSWKDLFHVFFYVNVLRFFTIKLEAMEDVFKHEKSRFPRFYIPLWWRNLASYWWRFAKDNFWLFFGFFVPPKYRKQKKQIPRIHYKPKEDEPHARFNALINNIRHIIKWLVSFLQTDHFKFATKITIAVSFIALGQWFTTTRDVFQRFRGEYAVIYVILIIGTTFSWSWTQAVFRSLGCAVAVLVSVLTWAIFGPKKLTDYGIIVSFAIIALPFFYIKTKYPLTIGRIFYVALIIYTSTVVGGYENRNTPNYFTFGELLYTRVVCVAGAVVIGLVLDLVLWPSFAREKAHLAFSNMLSDLLTMVGRVVDCLYITDQTKREKLLNSMEEVEIRFKGRFAGNQFLLQLVRVEPNVEDPISFATYQKINKSINGIFDMIMTAKICVWHGFGPFVHKVFIKGLAWSRKKLTAHLIKVFWFCIKSFADEKPFPQSAWSTTRVGEQFGRRLRGLQKKCGTKQAIIDNTMDITRYFAYSMSHNLLIQQIDQLCEILRGEFGEIIFIESWETNKSEEHEKGPEMKKLKKGKKLKHKGKEKKDEDEDHHEYNYNAANRNSDIDGDGIDVEEIGDEDSGDDFGKTGSKASTVVEDAETTEGEDEHSTKEDNGKGHHALYESHVEKN